MKRILALLVLCSSPLLGADICTNAIVLRQETCPPSTSCSTKGSTLTFEELDDNVAGIAEMCYWAENSINTGTTDNALLRADGTGGAKMQASPLLVADTSGNLSAPGAWTLSAPTSVTIYSDTTSATSVEMTPSVLNLQQGDWDSYLTLEGTSVNLYGGSAGFLISSNIITVSGQMKGNTGGVDIGDGGSDYVLISDTDAHMTFAGNATFWDDTVVPALNLKTTGSSQPGFESWASHSPLFIYWFDATTDEEAYSTIQMSHAWCGTSIYFHVHWIPKTTADGNPANQKVEWCIDYTWADYATVFPSNTTAICGSTSNPDDANVTADKHYITSVGTLAPGTGADGGSSILAFRLYRNGNGGNDNYEHDAGLISVDAHWEACRLGSNTDIPGD